VGGWQWQRRNRRKEVQLGLALRKLDLHLAGASKNFPCLQVVDFDGNAVSANAIRHLKECGKWRRRRRSGDNRECFKNPDNTEFFGKGIHDDVIAEQDSLADWRRLLLGLFGHKSPG